jgi:hypothetical protein
MAKESNAVDNIRTLPPPNGWQGWPTGIKASAQLGISIRRLRLLFESGNIARYACPDRTFRYDPDQIEALSVDLKVIGKRSLDDDEEENGLDELDEKRNADDAKGQLQSVNKTLVEALRNANAMVKDMHDLLSKGAKTQADIQDKVIQRLLEREEAREKALVDVYLAREQLFNQQLERDLAAKSAANLEARRSEMWTISKGHLEKLVDVAMAKWGLPKGVLDKLEPAIELLQKLQPAQLQVLLASGFLTKEQEELVKKIVTSVPQVDADDAAKVAAECERIRNEEAAKAAAAKEQQSCATPPPEPPAPPQP